MATLPVTILVRHGLKANLPASAPDGEPFFCVDTHEMFIGTGDGIAPLSSAGAATSFATILDGVNNSADMVVGTGATLGASGTGIIDATKINGVKITGTPTTGKLPIGQPDGSAVWADPFCQGVYDPGTNADTGGVDGGPIKPVLVGVRDQDGILRDLAGDEDGNLGVTIAAPVAVTGPLTNAELRATAVPVSGPLTDAQIRATALPVSGTLALADGTVVTLGAGSAVVGHVVVDSAGNVAITSLPALPAGSNVIGHVIVDSGAITETNLSSVVITPGTTASAKLIMVGGKSNDGTPQYRELPLGASARSVIIEGIAGGTAIPVTGPLTDTQLRATALPVSGPLTDVQLRATSIGVTLGAETTKVIGTINVASGQTIGLAAGSAVIGHVIVDSAGSVSIIALPAIPAGANIIGQVGIDQTTPGTTNKVAIGSDGVVTIGAALPAGTAVIGHVIVDSGAIAATLSAETTKVIGAVNQGTSPWVVSEATLDAAIVAQGTAASTKVVVIAGKSNDGTPQYKEIPLGASARSVIVEGIAGGTAVPVSISGNQGVNIAQVNGHTVIEAAVGVQMAGMADGLGNALTTNSTTITSKRALDINLLSLLGTVLATGNGTATAGCLRVALVSDQTQLTNALKTQNAPGTSGGASNHSTDTTGVATAIKASAGQLYGCELGNPNVGWTWCQVFNVAFGSVTLGSTVPVRSIPIPPNTTLVRDWSSGLAFSTAISYAFTTTRLGAGAPSNSCSANFDFV